MFVWLVLLVYSPYVLYVLYGLYGICEWNISKFSVFSQFWSWAEVWNSDNGRYLFSLLLSFFSSYLKLFTFQVIFVHKSCFFLGVGSLIKGQKHNIVFLTLNNLYIHISQSDHTQRFWNYYEARKQVAQISTRDTRLWTGQVRMTNAPAIISCEGDYCRLLCEPTIKFQVWI